MFLKIEWTSVEPKQVQPLGSGLVAPAAVVGMFALFVWETLFSFVAGVAISFLAMVLVQAMSRLVETNERTSRLLVELLASRNAGEDNSSKSLASRPRWTSAS